MFGTIIVLLTVMWVVCFQWKENYFHSWRPQDFCKGRSEGLYVKSVYSSFLLQGYTFIHSALCLLLKQRGWIFSDVEHEGGRKALIGEVLHIWVLCWLKTTFIKWLLVTSCSSRVHCHSRDLSNPSPPVLFSAFWNLFSKFSCAGPDLETTDWTWSLVFHPELCIASLQGRPGGCRVFTQHPFVEI